MAFRLGHTISLANLDIPFDIFFLTQRNNPWGGMKGTLGPKTLLCFKHPKHGAPHCKCKLNLQGAHDFPEPLLAPVVSSPHFRARWRQGRDRPVTETT